MNSYMQTIDLDTNETERYIQVYRRVKFCPYRYHGKPHYWRVEPSVSTNGWHFTYPCTYETCRCRFVFDDQNRFHKDQERPPESRNVLFDCKQFRINGKVTVRLTK